MRVEEIRIEREREREGKEGNEKQSMSCTLVVEHERV